MSPLATDSALDQSCRLQKRCLQPPVSSAVFSAPGRPLIFPWELITRCQGTSSGTCRHCIAHPTSTIDLVVILRDAIRCRNHLRNLTVCHHSSRRHCANHLPCVFIIFCWIGKRHFLARFLSFSYSVSCRFLAIFEPICPEEPVINIFMVQSSWQNHH